MNGISVDESKTINTSLIAVSFGHSVLVYDTHEFSPQAIDTGTSLIYVPDAVADAFYAQVCNSQSSETLTANSLLRYRGLVKSPSSDRVRIRSKSRAGANAQQISIATHVPRRSHHP